MDNAAAMKRWYKSGKALLDEISGSNPGQGEAYIWYLGQHGFVIKSGNLVFYIDVILNDFLDRQGVSHRVYPPPFEPSESQNVDYVFCSHSHGDHLNLKTLEPLAKANPSVKFVVPPSCKQTLTEAGIADERVIAARAGEIIPLSAQTPAAGTAEDPGSFSLVPVPAIHTRYIQDDGEKDANGDYSALGFIIKGEGISIYHCGDTWITPSLVQTLKNHAPLNIAMLPINGTDWERTMQNCVGNVSYLDAAKLARTIPVDLVFPSHYDMMAFNSENPARFADAMYTLCPEKRFHICALGERFIYRV